MGEFDMKVFSSCHDAIQNCIDTQSFAIAHMYKMEKTMDMHIHNCHEIYYSISGGKQFLINDHLYDFEPGDIFFINHHESHCLPNLDNEMHERIVISIHSDFLQKLSTPQTDLGHCFNFRGAGFSHRISLTNEDQKKFTYLIHRLSTSKDFGEDILDRSIFMELMCFLNKAFTKQCLDLDEETTLSSKHHEKASAILSYINQHLSDDLNISGLAEEFFLSPSYLSAIFKKETGTTIKKYITSQRIALAKHLLSDGHSVTEACDLCGFKDYSNFLKTFTKLVGISPKKYAQFSSQ